MAGRIKPEETVVRYTGGWCSLSDLDDVRCAAIGISVGLDPGGKTASALGWSLSEDKRPCLNDAGHGKRSVHLYIGFEFLKSGSQTLQPARTITDIRDVVGDRLRRSEADADVRRVSIPQVVADEGVIGIVGRSIVCRRDGFLKIGVGERNDVSRPCPQCGKIHTAFEVGP